MSFAMLKRSVMFSLVVATLTMAIGCGKKVDESSSPQVSDVSSEGDGHDHGGWWCAEHGVPEEDCSMCSSVAASKFKDKGDWCEEHNRAESQCFKCDPSRAEKFAKLYVAKNGHEPPKITE